MIAKRNFLVDGLILISFLILSEPALTGFSLHEWLGLSFFATIVIHLFLHWDWIAQVTLHYLRKLFHSSRLNYLIDMLLLVSFVAAMLSGLIISRTILPLFGIEIVHNQSWRFIHDFSANLMLFLVAVHFALHWKWIITHFKRLIIYPIRDRVTITALHPLAVPIKNEEEEIHYKK